MRFADRQVYSAFSSLIIYVWGLRSLQVAVPGYFITLYTPSVSYLLEKPVPSCDVANA